MPMSDKGNAIWSDAHLQKIRNIAVDEGSLRLSIGIFWVNFGNLADTESLAPLDPWNPLSGFQEGTPLKRHSLC